MELSLSDNCTGSLFCYFAVEQRSPQVEKTERKHRWFNYLSVPRSITGKCLPEYALARSPRNYIKDPPLHAR